MSVPSRYSKVLRRVYNDERFRRLSAPQPNGQSLFIRLLSGPELTNVPGLIPIGEAALAEALGWPLKGFREAFAEVEREELVKADWRARLVWIPNAIKHNEPASPKVVVSWAGTLDIAPGCPLKTEALSSMEAFLKAKGDPWYEAFRKAIGKPTRKAIDKPKLEASVEPTRYKEQEQEQDASLQEQEQDRAPEAFPTRGLLAKSFQRRWEQSQRSIWPGTKQDPDWNRIPPWLENTAKLRGISVESLIERVLDHWFADPWVIGEGHPTRHFAKHFERYLEPAKAVRGAAPTQVEHVYDEDLGPYADEVTHA